MNLSTQLKAGFVYEVEHLRPPRWMPRAIARCQALRPLTLPLFKLMDRESVHNLMPIEGLNHMLSVEFAGGTQVPTWYVGLFEADYTPLAASIMSTFPGLSTECTAYDESVRQTWVESTPASGATTNSANKAEFTMSASKTIYGAFLSSSSVKGGTTGVLASAAKFATAKVVDDDDVLRVTASMTLTSS